MHDNSQAALPVVEADIKWAGGTTGGTGTGEVLERARAGGSMTDAAMSIWRRATGKLFDLESRIVMQVSGSPGDSFCCRFERRLFPGSSIQAFES